MTAPSKMRIGGVKVKTACITCKARRIKCDEARPSCSRCARSKRVCGGYVSHHKPAQKDRGMRFINYAAEPWTCTKMQPDLDWQERRALDFFQNRSALELNAPFSSDLWSIYLLRMAADETTVRSAVVALATMHESNFHPKSDVQQELKQQAMQKYTQSIRKVVDLNRDHIQNASEIALVTCVLFAAIESLQGHIHSSTSHIMSGLRLMSELEGDCNAVKPPGPVPLNLLKCIFVDIGIQIMSVTEAPWAGLSWLDKQASTRPLGTPILTADEAQAEWSILMKDMVRLSNKARYLFKHTNMPNIEHQTQQDELRIRFFDWSTALQAMLSTKSSSSPGSADRDLSIISLQLSRSVTKGLLETLLRTDEMCFDEYNTDFKEAVNCAEKFFAISDPCLDKIQWKPPKFNFAFGILSSLYVICCRCRDHSTRHRALRLLRSCDTREGIFDSDLVYRVAEQWITIEELSAVEYWQTQHANSDETDCLLDWQTHNGVTSHMNTSEVIPECCRLSRIHTIFPEEKKADMTFISTTGEWRRAVAYWDK